MLAPEGAGRRTQEERTAFICKNYLGQKRRARELGHNIKEPWKVLYGDFEASGLQLKTPLSCR